jgi:hypothetical protein
MSPSDLSKPKTHAPLRFRWRRFAIFSILSLAGIATICGVLPLGYRAVGYVVVESPLPRIPLQLSQPPVSQEVMDGFVATQVSRLKGDKLLSDAVRLDTIRNTPWFRSTGDANERFQNLAHNLRVTQEPRTNYIAVALTTRVADDGPVIINQLIEKYRTETVNVYEDHYKTELKKYEEEEERIMSSLGRLRDEEAEFMKAEATEPGLSQSINLAGELWTALQEEAARLEAQKSQYWAAWQNMVVGHGQEGWPPEMRAIIDQDLVIARLRELKAMQELEMEASGSTTPATGPADTARKARLNSISRKLDELTEAKEKEVLDAEISHRHSLYLNAMAAEEGLLERIQEMKDRQRDIDRQMIAYKDFQERRKGLQHQLEPVSDYVSRLRMLLETHGVVRLSLIPAVTPVEAKRKMPPCPAGWFAMVLLVGVLISFTRRPRKEHEVPDASVSGAAGA